jgi:hypothetical protein
MGNVIRHYFARLYKKTLCYSKILEALTTAVYFLFTRKLRYQLLFDNAIAFGSAMELGLP